MTRRRALALVGLIGLGAVGYLLAGEERAGSIGPGRYRDGRGRWGREGPPATASGVLFEFAPASGTGVGTVCAGAAVTGSKGEVVTYSGGAGYCAKGSEQSGIANSDLVALGANVPRVMPGGLGTGGLGLLIERAVQNTVIQSQDFMTSWNLVANIAANPTRTANQAVAPDGTTTAERVQIPATSGAGYSILLQVAACPLAEDSLGLYVKGNGTTGTFDAPCESNSVSGWHCNRNCTYNSSTWTRCLDEGVPNDGTGPGHFFFGNASGLGGVSRSAADVFVWQADCATATPITSPITTTTVAVTRAVASASVTLAVAGQARSWADTYVAPSILHAGASLLQLFGDGGTTDLRADVGPAVVVGSSTSHKLRCSLTSADAGTATLDSTVALVTGVANTVSCAYNGTTAQACVGGFCNTSTVALSLPVTTAVYLGGRSAAGSEANGVHKKVCVDNTATGCVRAQSAGIAWLGDSITIGYSTLVSPPTYLARALNDGRAMFNFGVTGDRTDQMATRYTSTIAPGPARTLIYLGGINDVIQDVSAATAYANASATLDAAKAAGYRVVVVGTLPWANYASWTAGRQTVQNTYNQNLTDWATDAGMPFVDPSSLGTGSPLALTAANDSGDGLHPNATGSAALATLVQAAAP